MLRGWPWGGLTLLALTALLCAELVIGIGPAETGTEPSGVGPGPSGDAAVALVPVFSLPAPDEFHGLAERPLFAANRRPPQPLAEQKAVSKPKPKPQRRPEFILSAIVREGNRWIALVGTQGRGSSPPVEVEEGGLVAGWEVERIGPEGVVLRKGTQKAELTLRSY